MSLPVVLPGSCCPVGGTSQLAEPLHRNRARGLSGGESRMLLPGRPLLSLGLMQLLLGGSMVALSLGALSLSSSPPIRNSCPFWAASSVILSGIVGLTTWRKPMLLLVNIFILLSVVCVLLNLAGFVLCCQGAQLVSSMTSCQLSEVGDVCYCCSQSHSSKCVEEKMLELHPAHSCSTMRILLKKVLFALCALNALTTAVCLMAAALRYLQVFSTRTPCLDEARPPVEEGEEPAPVPDPDEFVAPAPPPSYFSTFYSYTPRLARRMLGESVIPLPHIYGARIKGVEVFCPSDPPPPYEAVTATESATDTSGQAREMVPTETSYQMCAEAAGERNSLASAASTLQRSAAAGAQRRIQRSNSDPVQMDHGAKVFSSGPPSAPQTTDSSTQTSQPTLTAHGQVTLRRGDAQGPRRPRPSSMVDYQSYRHTQLLVRRILEQPAAQGLTQEVQDLVASIRNVLESDQEHMDEAVRSATYIERVFTKSESGSGPEAVGQQQVTGRLSQTVPRSLAKGRGLVRRHSCGDLNHALDSADPRGDRSRPGTLGRPGGRTRPDQQERPHSLIGVFRETML
ncbi:endosomal transmembrane epsin interactor 1 [Synchiropus splendidus]|uniref:endosomal transmembrane epsin interactor 1 n=1 Tax=Synchiropus splendidus TaxID=270530 RepID=UPI00237EE712|nr:endosomal transmembrane epsin interactor 1 [Synchiropus splendidus]